MSNLDDEKKLKFEAAEIDLLLQKVKDGNLDAAIPVQSVNGKIGDVTLSADDVKARPDTWTPSAADVGADSAGTASSAVTEHNTATDAHNDIRLWLSNVETWVKNLLDADDETLNQTSEMIQYMKDNRELIEQVTTGKVSVTDIINNLTTNVSDKPLSAAQGVVLKGLIDALQTAVNSKAASTDLTAHTGNSTVHITVAERTAWNKNTTDIESLSEEIANYLPKFVGTDKVGKIAIVGTDGYITWIDMPEGSSGDVTGVVDEANNILLTGNLADGTYTLKYLNEDGTYTEVGTLEVGAIVTYTITQNLTAVTSDNSVAEVRAGESLTVNLTANDGYNLSTVAVTMGGADITSTAVSGGKISIANVTGDVVITAVAEEEVVTPVYTNLLPKAVDTDGSLYNGGKGYKSGYKMSGSSGGESATTGAYCSGFIPYEDVTQWCRIKNATLHSGANVNNIIFYDANKTKVYSATGATAGQFNSGVIVEGDVYKFKATTFTAATNIAFFRFSCGGITDETIVTVNEEIV